MLGPLLSTQVASMMPGGTKLLLNGLLFPCTQAALGAKGHPYLLNFVTESAALESHIIPVLVYTANCYCSCC